MSKEKNYWFRDINEDILFINEHVMRARSGMLIFIPIFLAFSFFHFSSMFTSQWVVDVSTASADMMDTNDQNQQLYAVEAVKRTYDYWRQTAVLCFALFEMIVGMNKHTVKFSPTIRIALWISRNKKPYYKPYEPKRFAWFIGALLIFSCLVFFNPWLIPIEGFIIPIEFGLGFLATCMTFMWLELSFAFCAGCWMHAMLAKTGIVKSECYACNNLDY
jgi:hypothetical protein